MPLTLTRRLQAMLEVEVALAEAAAAVGVMPSARVPAIRAAADLSGFDVARLLGEQESAGNLVIPLVRQLRQRVDALDPAAVAYVHWGATSQDIDDTALVLLLRESTAAVDRAMVRAGDAAADLAHRHAETPIAGRTWLQQATPTTFGAKAAVWLEGLERTRLRLAEATDAAAVLQLGGAVGTLAGLGAHGPQVAAALARRLELSVADVAWHTERSRIVDVACACGLVCGTVGKIGRDVALLSQTEVGEVAEANAPGRGGSSAMPHKRNPVSAAVAIRASVEAPGLVATLLAAMGQEHERAIGGWQAEWEPMSSLSGLTVVGSRAIASALESLVVHPARMRANLDAEGGVARAEGLSTALSSHVGRADAHRLVEAACRRALAEGRALAEIASADPAITAWLDAPAIARALDPAAFVSSASAVVARALGRWRPTPVEEPADE